MKPRDITPVLKDAALLAFLDKKEDAIRVCSSTIPDPIVDSGETINSDLQYHRKLKETVELFINSDHYDFLMALSLLAKKHEFGAAFLAEKKSYCGTLEQNNVRRVKPPAIMLQIVPPGHDASCRQASSKLRILFTAQASLQVSGLQHESASELNAAHAVIEFLGQHMCPDTYSKLLDSFDVPKSGLVKSREIFCLYYHRR
ncbi:MAG: hypothetical protein GC136_03355 [Alphaproteobacteria bacterium]|nr:hypothetical protein [Alphaproteobacteria bacterium]